MQPNRKRKFVPPFIAGSLLKKSNTEILKACAQKAMNKQKSVTTKVTPVKCNESKQTFTVKNTQKKGQRGKQMLCMLYVWSEIREGYT